MRSYQWHHDQIKPSICCVIVTLRSQRKIGRNCRALSHTKTCLTIGQGFHYPALTQIAGMSYSCHRMVIEWSSIITGHHLLTTFCFVCGVNFPNKNEYPTPSHPLFINYQKPLIHFLHRHRTVYLEKIWCLVTFHDILWFSVAKQCCFGYWYCHKSWLCHDMSWKIMKWFPPDSETYKLYQIKGEILK